MKGDIILAHKLNILNIVILIGAPPRLPIATRLGGPILCCGNIFYGGIKPDVKDFTIKAFAHGAIFIGNGNTPFEVPRNGAIPQAFIKPFQRD